MRYAVRFNPFASTASGIAGEIAELAARAPGVDTLELQLCIPRPNEFKLSWPAPLPEELDYLADVFDAAHLHGRRIWLSFAHYALVTPAQQPQHFAGLPQGAPIPADPARLMPWAVPPVPEDNLAAVVDWCGAFLAALGTHPALDALWLRGGQGIYPFGEEFKGDAGFLPRPHVLAALAAILPELRGMTSVPWGLHVQPELWRSSTEGPGWWMARTLDTPALAGLLVNVTCGRRVPVSVALATASTAAFPLARLVTSDHKLYHPQTVEGGIDPIGHLEREIGDSRRANLFGCLHWQYRPEGIGTTYTFRDGAGAWNDPVVNLWSHSGTGFV